MPSSCCSAAQLCSAQPRWLQVVARMGVTNLGLCLLGFFLLFLLLLPLLLKHQRKGKGGPYRQQNGLRVLVICPGTANAVSQLCLETRFKRTCPQHSSHPGSSGQGNAAGISHVRLGQSLSGTG